MAKTPSTEKTVFVQSKKKRLIVFGGALAILVLILGVAIYEKYAPHPYADLTVNPNDTNASLLDESLKASSADDYGQAIASAEKFLAAAQSEEEKQAAYVNLVNAHLGNKDSNSAYDTALEIIKEKFKSDRSIGLEITTATALLSVNDYDRAKTVVERAEKAKKLQDVDKQQLKNLNQIIEEGIKNRKYPSEVEILITRINVAKEQKQNDKLKKYYEAILDEISETEEDRELAGLRFSMQEEYDKLAEADKSEEKDE